MPVDFGGVIIAFVLWASGTVLAFVRIRAAIRSRPGNAVYPRVPAFVTVVITAIVSFVLFIAGIALVVLYDFVTGSP